MQVQQQDVLPIAEARREFPGASAGDDAMLRHVMAIGGTWSAAAGVIAAVGLAGLLASGLRPRALPPVADAAWWVGAALTLAGVLALAWAGCPVVTDEPARAARRKSLSVRAGLVTFVLGTVIAALAVLLR